MGDPGVSADNDRDVARSRVSVIMANYNGAAHIADAVRSVLAQTEPAIELIISDDGSTDDSLAVAQEAAAGDARVIILEGFGNTGPAAARNRALARAAGRWIAIVDNDDRIEPERLARLASQAEADGADIAADNMLTFYDGGGRAPHPHVGGAFARAASWISAAAYIRADVGEGSFGYLKPLFNRDALGERLRYDETLTIGEDSHLVTQLLLSGARMRLYPELGYHYRKRIGSISHRQNGGALDAMITALDTLDDGDDRAAAMALQKRRESLVNARAFLALVNALKAGDFAQAGRMAAARPHVVLMLREPIIARLRRR
jgi:succinoglycan biosynthesis protein ExoO